MTGFRFLREALEEYEDAIAYYERARAGLSEAFVHDVERAIALTLEFPNIGAIVSNVTSGLVVRRRLLSRFDVELDYIARGDELVVLALFHCKRRPGYWRERLDRLR